MSDIRQIRLQRFNKKIFYSYLCYLGLFQGDVGPPGAPGTPGKEGLEGPKVLHKTFFFVEN